MRQDIGGVRGIGRKRSGLLITVEGVEGSGKTTQCSRLATLLRREGHQVIETREPGGTPLAERIRELVLSASDEPMHPRCEALLVLAGRSQHRTQVIQPALKKGAIVLCDRFSDSTLAYQGYARGLNLTALRAMDRFATEGITPDLTFLFDVPISTGLARRGRPGRLQDRLDLEKERFHEKVRRGYRDLATKNPGRIRVIDGRPAPEIVEAKVADIVVEFLKRRQGSRPAGKLKRGKVRKLKS